MKKYVKMNIFLTLLFFLKTLKYLSLVITKNLIKQHLLFMQILNDEYKN